MWRLERRPGSARRRGKNGGEKFGGENGILTGQIIATSAEVTPNGGLIRELPQNPLNSGLGIILICPES